MLAQSLKQGLSGVEGNPWGRAWGSECDQSSWSIRVCQGFCQSVIESIKTLSAGILWLWHATRTVKPPAAASTPSITPGNQWWTSRTTSATTKTSSTRWSALEDRSNTRQDLNHIIWCCTVLYAYCQCMCTWNFKLPMFTFWISSQGPKVIHVQYRSV